MSVLLERPVALDELRWTKYAASSGIEHFTWWCRNVLIQSKGVFANHPLELELFELEFMGEALAVDDEGLRLWQSVALIVARKNGKTMLLAAYALYRLVHDDDSPEILLAASSDKQAGRLFDAAVQFIRKSPYLQSLLLVREYVGEIARVDGMGILYRVALNPNALHGYNPSLVIADELHAWGTPKMRKAWAALITGGGARPDPQTFTITTAGAAAERETSILGAMLDANERVGEIEKPNDALTISRNEDAQTLIYNYSAPITRRHRELLKLAKQNMLAPGLRAELDEALVAVKGANPASWITDRYLEKELLNPELDFDDFLQLHACVWSDDALTWIGKSRWEELVDRAAIDAMLDELGLDDVVLLEDRVLRIGQDVYLGLDGGRVNDTTAMGIAWNLPDGRTAVAAHVWSAIAGAAHHTLVPGGKIDNRALVPAAVQLREAGRRVHEIAYDTTYLQTIADMLEDEGFLVTDAWSAGAHRAAAWQAWLDGVDQGLIVTDGDPVLASHVTAAMAKNTDLGWKVSKLKQTRKIDALVACAMAYWRARVATEASFLY